MVSVLDVKLVRDLAARRGQLAAVAVTIFLGVALFAASYDAYQNLTASYDRFFVETHFADMQLSGAGAPGLRDQVSALDGVAETEARQVADLPLRIGSSTLLGRAVGMPSSGSPAVDDVIILEGKPLDPTDAKGVLVDHHLADAFGLGVGDTLAMNIAGAWDSVTVRGIVASPEYLWPARSRQEILVPPDQFGVVFVPGSTLDALPAGQAMPELLVRYAPTAARTTLDDRIGSLAAGAGAATQTRDQQPSNAALREDMNGFGELSIMFPLLFLGAAGLATYVLLNRLVLQQRAQIGLLVASGYRRRTILRHVLGFGLVTGAVGGIPGAVAGIALGGVVTDLYTGVIGLPDAVRVVELRPLTLVLALAFALGAGALSALAPALRASRIGPAEAMRGAVPMGRGGSSVFERLLPPLRGLPARWKMVLRGIGRNRVRSISTMVGVALAAILVLVSWGMMDTMQVIVDRQFGQIDRQDAEIVLAAPASDSSLAAIAGVDGVAAAEPVAHLPVVVASAEHSYVTSLNGYEPDTTMHGFRAPSGETVNLPSDGLLIGSALKDQLKVNAGDSVTVTLTSTGASVTDRIVGFVSEPLGTLAYGSLPHLDALFGADVVTAATTSVQVRYDARAASDAVRTRLEAVPGVLAVSDSQAIAKIFNKFMGLFYAFVGVMLVFGAVMAFAILFVTIGSNVAERGTELATMRAMGMPIGVLGRIVSGENLLLTLAGIIPGLILGLPRGRGVHGVVQQRPVHVRPGRSAAHLRGHRPGDPGGGGAEPVAGAAGGTASRPCPRGPRARQLRPEVRWSAIRG